jgi:hypothetical protein
MARLGAILIAGFTLFTQVAAAQSTKSATPDLTGVYEVISNRTILPGGLKNSGSPEEISLQPAAAAKAKAEDLNLDPAKTCQTIGPFRMMAREGNMIDILPSPLTSRIFMLFEDYFAGFFREIFLDRPPQPRTEFADRDGGQGDSYGRWDGDALVVDTINFNNHIWLNANGAPHSDAFHLNERYRLVSGGPYLEVKVTAEDPKVLAKPYAYTRYYQKVDKEVPQYVCTDDLVKHTIPSVN